MTVEIELKLAIAPDAVARFRRHALLRATRPTRRKLYGIYFDTPDFDLYRRRSAFRLRREGYHWVQTVKLDRGSVGGLSMRPEYEVRVSGNRPDFEVLPADARAALTPSIEARLVPVFVTDFQRTAWLVERPTGTVEIALDVGHIVAGEADQMVAEVELELKSGDGALLFELARELLDAVSLVPEYRSKALRGYGLAGVWRPRPVKSAVVAVTKDTSAAEAWRRSLLAGLEQLGANLPGLLAEDDPEYLHQTRVAVRRLRTMLGLGRSLGLAGERWNDGLRAFMSELSPARDWDVFVIETLASVRAALNAPERLDGLAERVEAMRAAARTRARAAAADRRLTDLMLDMGGHLLISRDEGPSLAKWAGTVLDKRLRRLREQAKGFAELDAAGQHQVRIAAKRLRYAGEAFSALSRAGAARYLDRVAAAQDALGRANDMAVAHRLLGELNRDGRMAYEVGLVEGFLAAQAGVGAEAGIALTRLVKARPFWK